MEAFLGGEAVAKLKEFGEAQIEMAAHIGDLSERLGVGTDELQQFQLGARLAGVDADSAAQSLGFLNKNIGEAITGNAEAAETFRKLHVALKTSDGTVRELGDVIPELADAFASMGSDQERTAVAMKIFGRAGAQLLPMLKDGSKGVAELQSKFKELGGGFSGSFIKDAKAADDQIALLKFGLQGLGSKLVHEALPYVMRLVDTFEKWIPKISSFVDKMGGTRVALNLFGIAAGTATFKAATGFAKLFGLMPKGSLIIAKTLASLGELGAIALAIGGVVWVFDQMYQAIQGNDSALVDLIAQYSGLDQAQSFVDQVSDAWVNFTDTMADLEGPLSEIGTELLQLGVEALPYIFKALELFVKLLATVAAQVEVLVKSIGDLYEGIAKGDFSKLKKDWNQYATQLFGDDNMQGGIWGYRDEAKDNQRHQQRKQDRRAQITQRLTAEAYREANLLVPASAGGDAATPAEVTQHNTTNITINGVPDARGVATASRGAMRDVNTDNRNALGAIFKGAADKDE